MNLAYTSFPVRCLGAAAFTVLSIGAGTAFADPPAQTHNYFAQIAAGTRPDDRAGIRGPNAPSFMTGHPVQPTVGVRPDDRGGIRGPNGPSFMKAPAPSSAVRPDDRAGIRGIDSTTVAATEVSLGGASSFDWGDAGVGAGSTLGLILIAGGLLVVRGRLRAPALRV